MTWKITCYQNEIFFNKKKLWKQQRQVFLVWMKIAWKTTQMKKERDLITVSKVVMGCTNKKTVTLKKLMWGKIPESKIGIEFWNSHYLKRRWRWPYSSFCSNSGISHLIKDKNKTYLYMKGPRFFFLLIWIKSWVWKSINLFSHLQCDMYENKKHILKKC